MLTANINEIPDDGLGRRLCSVTCPGCNHSMVVAAEGWSALVCLRCKEELAHPSRTPAWEYDDGGRAKAGFRGVTGDCACRSIAIATQRPYREIYDLIIEAAKSERASKRRRTKSHPRTGVWTVTMKRVMSELGFEWVPTMSIGSGCTVHLRADELPSGPVIARVSKHYVAVVDGVIRDTYDPSREGTRCVYGYFAPKGGNNG